MMQPWDVTSGARRSRDLTPGLKEGETSSIPTKWISEDGLTIHLVFSGDDQFSVRRGRITLKTNRAL